MGELVGQHSLAITEYGNSISQTPDLLHAVRDIDQSSALVAKSADQGEQLFRFGFR